jgi:sec-independent protein translocase protein TatC
MSLIDHLDELRSRLIRCAIAIIVGFAACFAFASEILEVMLQPLKQVLPPKSEMIATGLAEKFLVSMKAAFVAAIFLASPVIFYQIWRFIAPGLYKEERKLAIPVAFFTALCFVSGACFGYFIVFPVGFRFLANYASDIVTLMPKLTEYYSFSLALLLAFGVIFEMPVFIFFLARFGIVDHKWLRKKWRWAVVIIFVGAAILTPTPDAVSQLLMAGPMVLLYELSIWVAYFFGKKRKAPEENLPETAQPDASGESAGSEPKDEAKAKETTQTETPPPGDKAE